MARFIYDYTTYLLAQASRAASAGFHDRLAQKGIQVSTWRILATLYPNNPAGVSDLASACLTKQSTMTRQIDRLAKQGLVMRKEVQGDRRRVLVELTPAGKTLANHLTASAPTHEADIPSTLTADETSALKRTLTKLTGGKT